MIETSFPFYIKKKDDTTILPGEFGGDFAWYRFGMKFEVPQGPADRPGGGEGGEDIEKQADEILAHAEQLFAESFAAASERSTPRQLTTPDERTFALSLDIHRRYTEFTDMIKETELLLRKMMAKGRSEEKISALEKMHTRMDHELANLTRLLPLSQIIWRLRGGVEQMIGRTWGDPRVNAQLRKMGETEMADDAAEARKKTSNDTLDAQRQVKPMIEEFFSKVVIRDDTSPFVREVVDQLRPLIEALGSPSGAA